jgi:hypothetical protein
VLGLELFLALLVEHCRSLVLGLRHLVLPARLAA